MLQLTLRDDVNITKDVQFVRLSSQTMSRNFPPCTNGVSQALDILKGNGNTESEILDVVLEEDGFEALMGFTYILKSLESIGFINYSFEFSKSSKVKLSPLGNGFSFVTFDINDTAEYQLSKFSFIKREEGQFVFESPLAHCNVKFESTEVAVLIMELYDRQNLKDWIGSKRIDDDKLKQLLVFLFNMNCLEEVDDSGKTSETNFDNPLAYWELHDLYFHSQSRMGRTNKPYGGTFPFGKDTVIPNYIKEVKSEKIISLSVPDMQDVKNKDISLTEAIESRKSIREHGDHPISMEQLSEFLYRTNRVVAVEDKSGYKFVKKNYPSGGGLYELEIYPVIHQCDGIESGVYHYDGLNHSLSLIKESGDESNIVLGIASKTALMKELPQVLFLITCRFQRLSHKYRSVSYALMLKHVGVLYHHMYLVATSMGLAPCGLGGGDSDLASQVLGTNYYEETSIGEFVLGSI